MESLGWPEGLMILVVLFLTFWSLPWKGIALWKAARRDQLVWFIALLIINTAGLLEIIYIFFVAREPDLISQSRPPA